MQIKIEYLPVDGLPPKFEVLATPWAKDWDHMTCEIKSTKGDLAPDIERDHLWMLSVEQITRVKKPIGDPGDGIEIVEIREEEKNESDYYRLLKHTCRTAADYIEWLEKTVMYISVDGQLFWENIPYKEAQAKLHDDAEAEIGDDDDMLDELFGV